MLDGRGCLKITDFGEAEVFQTPYERTPHLSHNCVGSEPYMAPEEFICLNSHHHSRKHSTSSSHSHSHSHSSSIHNSTNNSSSSSLSGKHRSSSSSSLSGAASSLSSFANGTTPGLCTDKECQEDRGFDPRLVDIWACGVIYLAMVWNRIPWRKAVSEDPHYRFYLKARNTGGFEMIEKLQGGEEVIDDDSDEEEEDADEEKSKRTEPPSDGARGLIKWILEPVPERRATMKDIFADRWFRQCLKSSEMCMGCGNLAHTTAANADLTLVSPMPTPTSPGLSPMRGVQDIEAEVEGEVQSAVGVMGRAGKPPNLPPPVAPERASTPPTTRAPTPPTDTITRSARSSSISSSTTTHPTVSASTSIASITTTTSSSSSSSTSTSATSSSSTPSTPRPRKHSTSHPSTSTTTTNAKTGFIPTGGANAWTAALADQLE
ncbi:serine/threonine-protein kinase HAL4/sat4, partial [Quaeritorhiza haematococci]